LQDRSSSSLEVQLHLDTETQELELSFHTREFKEFDALMDVVAPACGLLADVARRRKAEGVGRYTITIKLSGYPDDKKT